MPERFTFIATKTTADFVVPVSAASQQEFNRKVKNAFSGLVGGVLRCGDLLDRPVQNAVSNHLLCDGSTINRAQFPELVQLLNPGGTTATLPNYTGTVTITAPTVTQTVNASGTVSTGAAVTDSGDAGGTTGGNVFSGGRIRPLNLIGGTVDEP